jgi:GNAT superfamily N-acetyltransferase
MLNKASLLEERLGRKGISFRPVNFTHFESEMENLRQAYNLSNEGNHHFIPLDSASFLHMAHDISQLIKPGYLPLALHDGKIVGYALTMPDYNEVFRHFTKGRLFPFGWYYLLRSRRHIKRCRVMILGTLPAYRGLGIDWCLYARTAAFVREQGLPGGEACYVMQDNLAMNRMMQRLNGKVAKEYKVFGKEIA